MASLKQVATTAQKGAGVAGETLGQKAVQLVAKKAPADVQSRLVRLTRWCKKHPISMVAIIVTLRAMVGLFTGVAAKTTE
jgi:hypothetical protein